jgi:hypothetical protein
MRPGLVARNGGNFHFDPLGKMFLFERRTSAKSCDISTESKSQSRVKFFDHVCGLPKTHTWSKTRAVYVMPKIRMLLHRR